MVTVIFPSVARNKPTRDNIVLEYESEQWTHGELHDIVRLRINLQATWKLGELDAHAPLTNAAIPDDASAH